MKKILINILIFFSVFVVVDKVSALPLGTDFDNFSDEKEEAARFYTTQTSTALYSISDTTSLVTDDVYVGGNNTSIRFNSNIAIKKDMTYKVVIKYVLSSVDNLDIQYHWQIDYVNYEVKSFYSYCVAKECIIEYTFTSLEDSNYVWVQGNARSNLTYTFNEFNSAVSYLYKAKVTEVTGEEEEEDTTEDTVYFDTSHENFTSVYDELKSKLEEIKSVLSDNPYNYNYVVYFGVNDYDVKEIVVGLIPPELEYGINNDFYCTYSATSYDYKGMLYNLDGACFSKTNKAFLTYKYYSLEKLDYPYDSLITKLRHDIKVDPTSASDSSYSGSYAAGSHLSVHYSSSDAFNFKNNKANYFENHTSFIMPYISSIELYNYYYRPDSTIKSYSIQIDDLKVSVGHYLSASDSYVGVGYSFVENIDDYDYAKMIFNFDVNALSDRNNKFDVHTSLSILGDFDFDTKEYKVCSECFKVSEPYLEYTLSTGEKDLVLIRNEDLYNRKLNYDFSLDNVYNKKLPDDIVELKLIIPMDYINDVRFQVGLETKIPFTYSYEKDSDYEPYYETIDLSNKYGVMLMPKLKDNNSGIMSTVFYGDVESILVYDTYDYKNAVGDSYEADPSFFQYVFFRSDIDYNLFVKSERDDVMGSYVKIDNRYFSYYVVENKYSMGQVENPNTGNSDYIDFGYVDSRYVSFTDISSVFDYISEQLSENNEAYLLFSNSVREFFDTMPLDVYILIVTVVAVLFLGVALALGGWK